nr:MAG TPA: hypothetical protein [Inoviridae sp.]
MWAVFYPRLFPVFSPQMRRFFRPKNRPGIGGAGKRG